MSRQNRLECGAAVSGRRQAIIEPLCTAACATEQQVIAPPPQPDSLKREVSNPRAKSHDAENQSLNQKLRAPMDKMSGASPDILSNQFASGSQMRNVLPEPISLSTVIWPRCRFTSV
jgi:hypothetical protein